MTGTDHGTVGGTGRAGPDPRVPYAMAPDHGATVRAVNALTARWARHALRDEGTVFTAAGLWPLLASLTAGAHGPARAELAHALGTHTDTYGADPAAVPATTAPVAPADSRALDLAAREAARRSRDLVAQLRGIPGVDAALGLWTRDVLALEPEWAGALPPLAHGELTGDAEADRARLDDWASSNTGGQIPAMPVEIAPDTLLVLASALTVRTRWARPFEPGWGGMVPESGPWAGRRLADMFRVGTDLDEIAVATTPAGAVTRFRVEGEDEVDVHLLLGEPEAEPASVLAAGAVMPARAPWIVPGPELPYGEAGPGVTVSETTGWDETPKLSVRTVPFTVSDTHDLLREPEPFGLSHAGDLGAPTGHFAGVSRSFPLALGSARQSVTASFTAEGFYAAAVTAMAASAAGVPQARARLVHARFDRPFGFLAVHRPTGLVLVAGWVTDPDPAPEASAPPPMPR
ncbi:serpin family protein [Streptomyces daliensis]